MTKKEKIETKDWTYVGEVKNGKPHGKGIAWYSNDNFYLEGIFKNGDYPKNKRKKVSKKIYNLFLYAKSIN